MMTMKTFTVGTDNGVTGNNTVRIGHHFKLEGTSTDDFHGWDSAGNDVCRDVVDKCPMRCGENVEVLSTAKVGATFRLGTSFAATSGSNGDLTVGSG
jgi:hypothetical protein